MEMAHLALRQAGEHPPEKHSTITLEKAESVFLKVFKTVHSAPKMIIQFGSNQKLQNIVNSLLT